MKNLANDKFVGHSSLLIAKVLLRWKTLITKNTYIALRRRPAIIMRSNEFILPDLSSGVVRQKTFEQSDCSEAQSRMTPPRCPCMRKFVRGGLTASRLILTC